MEQAAWRIDGASAELLGHDASVALDHPSQGVAGFAGGGSAVFGVAPAGGGELAFVEAYCRGADLVARYAPSEGFPFRTEVYWRCESSAVESPRLTLIVSVETDLLDTRPELTISSTVDGSGKRLAAGEEGLSEASEGEAAAALVDRPSGSRWFEAVHPSDAREAELSLTKAGEPTQLAWRLFTQFLEKGVIRRVRLTGALLDASSEPNDYYRDFAQQAPPLTV